MSYNTSVTYTGNGTQTDFSIPFSYDAASEVQVVRLDTGASLPFTLPTSGTCRLNTALANGVQFSIYRDTDASAGIVNWTVNTSVRSSLLNSMTKQFLKVMQEVKDGIALTKNTLTYANLAQSALTSLKNAYYGGATADPTTRPDGTARVAGDAYYNTTGTVLKIWSGSAWTVAIPVVGSFLQTSNNLSDLTNAATARSNLGLATIATSGSGADLTASSVTSAKLAAGAALANIGYTPVSKAGDTMTGNYGITGTLTMSGATSYVINGSGYFNFGSTGGSTGYGLRDNSGSVEVKESGGQWIPIKDYYVSLTSAKTLVSNTSAQAIFAGNGGPTNGAVTLPVGTYFFEMMVRFTGLSASSHNLTLSFGGTATIGSVLAYEMVNLNLITSTSIQVQSASTATTSSSIIKGVFKVTAAGTVIPQVTQGTATAAATVVNGSYLLFHQCGLDTDGYVGPWS